MLAGFRGAAQLISVQSADRDGHDELRKVQGAEQQIAEAELPNRHLVGTPGCERCRSCRNVRSGVGGRVGWRFGETGDRRRARQVDARWDEMPWRNALEKCLGDGLLAVSRACWGGRLFLNGPRGVT